MLTPIVRYGRMLKVDMQRAACRVRSHWTSEGSVFAGTISSTCHSVDVHVEIDSDDDPGRVAAVIRNAEAGCYAQSALQEPVDVTGSVDLNGGRFDYTQFPRRVERR